MPPPEQRKAQKDYRWPAATIDGLEKLVFDYFFPPIFVEFSSGSDRVALGGKFQLCRFIQILFFS